MKRASLPCARCKGPRPSTYTGTYCRGCQANNMRKWVLGLSWEQVEALEKLKVVRCPICEDRPGDHLDHDHATGRIRGWICDGCNIALGRMGENPERFERAAAYLRSAHLLTPDQPLSSRAKRYKRKNGR